MKKNISLESISDSKFENISNESLNGIKGGEEHTMSSNCETDLTYVTENTDQYFSGDGLSKGDSWIYDMGDLN